MEYLRGIFSGCIGIACAICGFSAIGWGFGFGDETGGILDIKTGHVDKMWLKMLDLFNLRFKVFF